jgi:ABC-type sugar transport system ATPase subunit
MTPVRDTSLLEIRGLSKQFGPTRALDDVSVTLRAGEIRALLGENGAGKSTLVKIISGEYPYRDGSISLDGEPYRPRSPVEAEKRGIVRVAQEPSTVPDLTVAENTFLGHLQHRRGVIRWGRLQADARALYDRLGIPIDISARAASLSLAQQQLVAIASALVHDARLLIMDEPTSTISETETRALFVLLRQLRDSGVSILFISHRLHEVFELAEQVTVMRDGRVVGERVATHTSPAELVSLMVGRGLERPAPRSEGSLGPPVLEVRNLSRRGAFRGVSFEIAPGEIVGVAGLTGSGRSELARAIFGAEPAESGSVLVGGKPVTLKTPRDAIAAGIGYVPEDRKLDGLALSLPVRVNVSVLRLKSISRFGFVRRGVERLLATRLVEQLDVRPRNPEARARTLSGGNQQKVVIGRWLAESLRILLMDEPTRGVDVGAKAEIHKLMRALAEEGMAILMISSEMDEIIAVPDRVIVMHEGVVTGEFSREAVTEEAIVSAASGLAS